MSVPRPTSASPTATATADPLDEPPGIRSGSSGFCGVPVHGFTPSADRQSSVRFVFPTILAPAARAAATTGASRSAGFARSAITGQAAVVGTSSTSMASFTARRGPPPRDSMRSNQVVMHRHPPAPAEYATPLRRRPQRPRLTDLVGEGQPLLLDLLALGSDGLQLGVQLDDLLVVGRVGGEEIVELGLA